MDLPAHENARADDESTDSSRVDAILAALGENRDAGLASDRRAREALALGRNDFAVVRYLIESERRGVVLTPGEIAHALGVSTAATTALIDRLEAAGFVRRERHPTDRRSVIVRAALQEGSEVHRIAMARDSAERRVIAALPPRARKALLDALESLTAALRRDGE